jgi:hypothetical protein
MQGKLSFIGWIMHPRFDMYEDSIKLLHEKAKHDNEVDNSLLIIGVASYDEFGRELKDDVFQMRFLKAATRLVHGEYDYYAVHPALDKLLDYMMVDGPMRCAFVRWLLRL